MSLLSPALLTQLTMPAYLGQRSASFKFVLTNAVKAHPPIELQPLRDTTPTLSHDTTRTIKRQLQGLTLNTIDSALINVLQSRLSLFMIIGGVEFPLGRYMFADASRLVYTNGRVTNASLYDEMFIIDQQLENSFSPASSPLVGQGFSGLNCATSIRLLLTNLPVTLDIEPTPYVTIGSWNAGTTRGTIVEQIALDGDYFSPWFGNDTEMHFIRTFDPINVIPQFDLDVGNTVITNSIIETDDLITAPNRFVVVSNGVSTDDDLATAIVGRADVPITAPHSIVNRGFVIPEVVERQINSISQAFAIAQNLALRQTVFERVELATVPDPRHDSYDVIKWQGERWLELAWTLPLQEGAAMGHLMRKAYS
jgi:hypothetical protein